MPADTSRRAQRGGLLIPLQPLEQRKRRHLRVDGDRKATDVGDARRRDVQGAAKLYDAVGGGVDVVDADVSEPARAQAHLSCVLRQLHQAADGGLSDGEQGIGRTGHRRILRAPADDLGVELFGALRVRRRQLVPDEAAMRIDHVRSDPSLRSVTGNWKLYSSFMTFLTGCDS